MPPPPTVVLIGASLVDSGDGDRWPDTNETVGMFITVYNRMGVDLTGLVARLSTDDPKITCISDPVVEIPELADGEIRTTADGFSFLVADVDRATPTEDFSVRLAVSMSADQFASLPSPQDIILDLDLDVSGGSGPGTFHEDFENGLGSFVPQQLDEDLNPPDDDLLNYELGVMNADGYRCQYHNPDWEESFSFGRQEALTCFPNPNLGLDHFFFGVTSDRAFSGAASLHWGIFLDEVRGFTVPTGQLEAIKTMDPISLAWGRVCSVTRTMSCESDLDCPVGEDCVSVEPQLRFKHQISMIDHREGVGAPGTSADRAVVQVQIEGDSTDWINLVPYLNVYDTQPFPYFFSCTFDPIDDGNDEDDFFDPDDPNRLYGPSSTCLPKYSFVDQGSTAGPFDPGDVGDASDGPGLNGSLGEGTWVESRFDLGRFVGRRLRLRFLVSGVKLSAFYSWEDGFHGNPEPNDDGWFVDDIVVTDTLTEPASISVDSKDNIEIKQDWDLDGIGAVCDCAPEDGTVWTLPGEVQGLRVTNVGDTPGTTTLSWSPPASLGGTVVSYDTIRSIGSPLFGPGTSSCVESGDGSDLEATDDMTPQPVTVHYYLVRARHGCGEGTVGADSQGLPRHIVSCPAM